VILPPLVFPGCSIRKSQMNKDYLEVAERFRKALCKKDKLNRSCNCVWSCHFYCLIRFFGDKLIKISWCEFNPFILKLDRFIAEHIFSVVTEESSLQT